jgi:hypothetical protein
MRTRQINSIMKGSKLWENCTSECKWVFIKHMRGVQYGMDALTQAFVWFMCGWRAADIQRLKEAAGQVNTDRLADAGFLI